MIYVYNDYGAGQSCEHAISAIKNYTLHDACYIDAKALIAGNWRADAKLLIMPGGFDLGYKKKLNGPGNAVIKEYVCNGGAYLGICAGAYYASARVEFNKLDNEAYSAKISTVDEERELAFFSGAAIGPLFEYDYKTYAGARILKIDVLDFGEVELMYNGGSYFDGAKQEDIIGRYNGLPMILSFEYGAGRCLLSALHFEYMFADAPGFDASQSRVQYVAFVKHLFEQLGLDVVA